MTVPAWLCQTECKTKSRLCSGQLIRDIASRVSELRKSDLSLLAQIGDVSHRRDALWQVEYVGRPAGPL
jgi:hypothetical protein